MVDNGNNTVTVSNGIVAIIADKGRVRLNSIKYTYNNNGTPRTTELMRGNTEFYWGGFYTIFSNGSRPGFDRGAYSATVDPSGNSVDIKYLSDDSNNGNLHIGSFETHFTMRRGSPGLYVTGSFRHGVGDAPVYIGAFGHITRVSQVFNWLSADATRNYFVGELPSGGIGGPDIPKESALNINGGLSGEYRNKFSPALDHGDQRAWGFSSVGTTGTNIGLWEMANLEYNDGGPLKRDNGVTLENVIGHQIMTQEVGQGTDSLLAQDEVWSKTCGPWFFYCNNVPASITDPAQAAQALFNDANAQDSAEKGAWPYSWFVNSAYAPASDRSNVSGTLVLSDPGNRNPDFTGTWVGLVQQPLDPNNPPFFDFQKWLKPYQFWTHTDSAGRFTIPDVIAGSNYTLWAFGPVAGGTFASKPPTGGLPPFELTSPASPMTITVPSGGGTYTLPSPVNWTPRRNGATVFEIGVANRKTDEFRHGEDFWAAEHSPVFGFPTPVWGGQAYFLQEFPNGVTYNVGTSRWDTDWNFVLPGEITSTGGYLPAKATINFNLASAPSPTAAAALYVAFAGDNGGKVVFTVNGHNLSTETGVTAEPSGVLLSDGYRPPGGRAANYEDNSSIHMSNHGPFEDVRIHFSSAFLQAGANTITVTMNNAARYNFAMVDYLRLELAGYKPPAPSNVAVYPGNNRNLVTWPVMPGASRYRISRSTTSGSGYVDLVTGQLGPVSGSDSGRASYNDTTAANNITYYYLVSSWNLQNGFGPASAQATGRPSSTLPNSAPVAPTVTATSNLSHLVNLSWTASPGASYYVITRRTLAENNVNNGAYVLRTIVLKDYVPGTTYVDNTVSNGKIYDYSVKAVNAAGSSGNSAFMMAVPQPPIPAPPGGLSATALSSTSVKLTWTAAANATGYVIYRSTTPGTFGPFPTNYVWSGVETFLTNNGLAPGTTYYYRVTAVNSGSISPHALATVTTP